MKMADLVVLVMTEVGVRPTVPAVTSSRCVPAPF